MTSKKPTGDDTNAKARRRRLVATVIGFLALLVLLLAPTRYGSSLFGAGGDGDLGVADDDGQLDGLAADTTDETANRLDGTEQDLPGGGKDNTARHLVSVGDLQAPELDDTIGFALVEGLGYPAPGSGQPQLPTALLTGASGLWGNPLDGLGGSTPAFDSLLSGSGFAGGGGGGIGGSAGGIGAGGPATDSKPNVPADNANPGDAESNNGDVGTGGDSGQVGRGDTGGSGQGSGAGEGGHNNPGSSSGGGNANRGADNAGQPGDNGPRPAVVGFIPENALTGDPGDDGVIPVLGNDDPLFPPVDGVTIDLPTGPPAGPVAPVPEPATLVLLGSGLIVVAQGLRRRRKRNRSLPRPSR